MKKNSNILRAAMVVSLIGLLASCSGDKKPTPKVKNNLEVIAQPLLTGTEDSEYSFTIEISGQQGLVTIEIENGPSWLEATNNGRVFGTPMVDADTGVFENVTITVADSDESISIPPFTMTITPVNDLPQLELNDSLLMFESDSEFEVPFSIYDEEGDTFDVQVTGMDNLLTYSIAHNILFGSSNPVDVVENGELVFSFVQQGEVIKQVTFNASVSPANENDTVVTLVGSPRSEGIHLVIVGDGYQEHEFNLLKQDALDFVAMMEEDSGIALHMENWNIHVVKAFSNESGSDTNYGEDDVDTYFDSGFNCNDIQRLICADVSKVNWLLIDVFPNYDHAMMIVNKNQYGGSGGQIAIYARTAPEVALHELGHSFADLADEYIDSNLAENAANNYVEGRYANVTQNTDANSTVWSHWIEDKENYPTDEGQPGVGLFEGSLYNESGFYRPMSNSRMMSNSADFGPVNSEQWILSIYRRTGAVLRVNPVNDAVKLTPDTDFQFSVVPAYSNEVQSIQWELDGGVLSEHQDQQTLLFNKPTGDYVLKVTVKDKSNRIRKTSTYADYEKQWAIEVR
jgi:hypothetical protein